MTCQSESLQTTRFIRCSISGKYFCIRMSWVRRIRNAIGSVLDDGANKKTKFDKLTSDINHCPVIKLDKIIEYSDRKIEQQKILLLCLADKYFGILVDTVENIFDVSPNQIYNIPSFIGGISLDYFDKVVSYKKDLILSLSLVAIYNNLIVSCRDDCLNVENCYEDLHRADLSIAHHRQKKVVIFTTNRQGEILYGLSITQIPQILQLSSILLIPGSKDYIRGVIEWRGIVLPVIDISLCVEKQRTDINGDCRIIVVRLVSMPVYVAVVIQAQILIQNFPMIQDLYEQDGMLNIESVIDQFQFRNKTLVVPNIDQIVMSSETSMP